MKICENIPQGIQCIIFQVQDQYHEMSKTYQKWSCLAWSLLRLAVLPAVGCELSVDIQNKGVFFVLGW